MSQHEVVQLGVTDPLAMDITERIAVIIQCSSISSALHNRLSIFLAVHPFLRVSVSVSTLRRLKALGEGPVITDHDDYPRDHN